MNPEKTAIARNTSDTINPNTAAAPRPAPNISDTRTNPLKPKKLPIAATISSTIATGWTMRYILRLAYFLQMPVSPKYLTMYPDRRDRAEPVRRQRRRGGSKECQCLLRCSYRRSWAGRRRCWPGARRTATWPRTCDPLGPSQARNAWCWSREDSYSAPTQFISSCRATASFRSPASHSDYNIDLIYLLLLREGKVGYRTNRCVVLLGLGCNRIK